MLRVVQELAADPWPNAEALKRCRSIHSNSGHGRGALAEELPRHDRAAVVKADNVERVLADVDADRGNTRIYPVGLGSAPLFGRPIQGIIRSNGGSTASLFY